MAEDFVVSGRLKLDTSQLDKLPADVQAAVKKGTKAKGKVEVDADTDQLHRKLKQVESEVKAIERNDIDIKVDTSQVTRAETKVKGLGASLKNLQSSGKLQQMSMGLMAGQQMGMMPGLTSALTVATQMPGAGTAGMLGAGIGVLGAGMAGQASRALYGGTVGVAASSAKLDRSIMLGFKADAEKMTLAASSLSGKTAFMTADFKAAILQGKTLTQNYGLQNEQILKLISASADLAATSPYEDIQTVSGAFERVQSAIRGEAEASERLGMTLNDTYMQNMAANGAYKTTWGTMNDLQKAQARYNEVLVQAKDVLGAASDESSLDFQMRSFNAQLTEMGIAMGKEVVPAMIDLIALANEFLQLVPVKAIVKTGGWVARAGAYMTDSRNQWAAPGSIPGIGPLLGAANIVRQNQDFINKVEAPKQAKAAGQGVMDAVNAFRLVVVDQTGRGIQVKNVDASSNTASTR